MSEDTMREEFEATLKGAYLKRHANGGGYVDPEISARWSTWKACAAIKDAEIAKLKKIPMKYKRMEFNAQLQQEIAARDLMINELRERITGNNNFLVNCSMADSVEIELNNEALTKSEHHDRV